MIIADGITALGVEKIDTTNLDAVVIEVKKHLCYLLVLQMIGLSNEAVAKIESKPKVITLT